MLKLAVMPHVCRHLLVYFLFLFGRAHAEGFSENRSLTISYLTNRLQTSGLHRLSDTSPADGLDAEQLARQEGTHFLRRSLESSCTMGWLSTDWDSHVRSLGSVIYKDGVFEILLAGRLRQILNVPSQSRNFVTEDGRRLQFRFSERVPFSQTQCGVISLEFAKGERLRVWPTPQVEGDESGETVTLQYLAGKGVFAPADEKASVILSKSNLRQFSGDMQNSPLALPLVP